MFYSHAPLYSKSGNAADPIAERQSHFDAIKKRHGPLGFHQRAAGLLEMHFR